MPTTVSKHGFFLGQSIGSRVTSGAHQLERHLLPILIIGAECPVYLAHPADTDQLDNLIRADPASDPGIVLVLRCCRSKVHQAFVGQELRIHLNFGMEQALHFAAKISVLGANLREDIPGAVQP